MRKRAVSAIAILLTVALGGGLYAGLKPKGASPGAADNTNQVPSAATASARASPVRVAKIVAQPVHYDLKCVGDLQAQDVCLISAQVPGTVSDASFNEGDDLKTTQVLCRISYESHKVAVLKQRAIYEEAVATLADAIGAL